MRTKFLITAFLAFTVLSGPSAYAETAPTVSVRAATHENFDRLVFDWPKGVKFQLRHDGAKVSITFESAAAMKIPSTIDATLSRARGFAQASEGNRVTVSFTVDSDATLKAFPNDSAVVVDIQGKAMTPTAPVKAEKQKTEQKPDAAKTKVIATAEPQALLPTPATPSPTRFAPATGAEPQEAFKSPVAATPPVTTPPPTASAVTIPVQAPAPAPSAAPPSPPVVAVATPPPEPLPSRNAKTPSFNFSLSDEPFLVATLDPHTKTRAAIYLRANVGYVVFDKKLTLSPTALENGIPAFIDLQPFDLPKNSGYRFATPSNATLYATLDGTAWKLYLSKKQQTPPVTTSLVAQPDFALGARFMLPLPDGPDPIRMTDPVVGDDLILVPLAQSEAFNAERRMPDFSILPAAQGLVIKPQTDKLTIRTVSDGVEITAEGGLLLSRATDTGAAQQSVTKSKASAAGKSLFDFSTWGGKPGETFTQTRQRLQQTIVDVPESERNRVRLELARFYFAKGEGEEAVSLLTSLAKQVPDLRAHRDFMVLLGASKVLAYRSEEGLDDLSIPSLVDQPEVILWQAVALAQMREWKQAEEKFSTKQSILTGYPEPFFSRFFVLAVESALAADQVHEAADWLNFVSASPHTESIEPALAFLRGAVNAKAGRAEAAEDAWKEARSSKNRLYKVRAELSLIDLGVSNGSLTPAQAADRLEALRFGWRGDDLEVDILHRLGQFYIQAKNVKSGINALSQAATLYPSSPLTPGIRTEITATLREAIIGNLAKKLSPLDTLTLYHQYRDLLPSGKEGNDTMLSLSERLVAVDLLDQAASLLEDLAKNRLQGEDKTRAVLRLAAIRLLDHKPNEAIVALDILGGAALPSGSQNERVLLQARALSELHRDDEATALLKDNASDGATLLRADIAMRGQKWAEAAKILMELVGSPPPSDKTLSPEQATALINASIAYALANDQTSLDKLAIDYGEGMSSLPQKSTFAMLTQPEKMGQLRDLAAAQVQLSQVDMFQGFLNNYRNGTATGAAKN